MSTTALGWILCATLLGAAVFYLAYVRPWKAGVDTLPDDVMGEPTASDAVPPTIGARTGSSELE